MAKEVYEEMSDEDAEEFARRMVASAEDIGMMEVPEDWTDFVASKLYMERGQEISDRQAEALERGAGIMREELSEVGVRLEYPIVGRPWQANFRDIMTGQYVGFETVMSAISALHLF